MKTNRSHTEALLQKTAAIQKTASKEAVEEHILVCISPSASNAEVIRAAARTAAALHGQFTALYVETPSFGLMREGDKRQLRENRHLAEELGARVETVYGEDVPFQIAEYALLFDVTVIFLGYSGAKLRFFFGEAPLSRQLKSITHGLEIHIIPNGDATGTNKAPRAKKNLTWFGYLFDTVKSLLILLLATSIGFAFNMGGFTDASIITIYILGVLIISVVTQAKIYCLLSSLISVFVFNFYFVEPRYTFVASDGGSFITLVVMFIATFLTSSLAINLKMQAQKAARSAFRAKVMFDTNRLLQKAGSDEEIISVTANQLIELMKRDIVIYPVTGQTLGHPTLFLTGMEDKQLCTNMERKAALQALENNSSAGATTNTIESARCLYLPIRMRDAVYGVVGVCIDGIPLDSFENNVLLSILGECALALENSANARAKEQAAVHAKNEQLRANLLRAISHDLRTPLTSISGNASNLLTSSADFDEEIKKQIYTDIYDDSIWLIGLVENILAITRIEEGRTNLNFSAELMDEVIAEALQHTKRERSEHHITTESSDEFILVRIDANLIMQVIINVVDNAIKYTPVGSDIVIRTEKADGFVRVSIADNGPGIPDEMKPRVFDMFFSSASKVSDSHRSLGIGLSLCKSIIAAHGGDLSLCDNTPHGTIFSFTLPAEEVEIHE